jgi:hypothetical protein
MFEFAVLGLQNPAGAKRPVTFSLFGRVRNLHANFSTGKLDYGAVTPHPFPHCHVQVFVRKQNRPPWGIELTSVPQQLRQFCLTSFELLNLASSGTPQFDPLFGTAGTPIDRGTLPRWRLTKLVG